MALLLCASMGNAEDDDDDDGGDADEWAHAFIIFFSYTPAKNVSIRAILVGNLGARRRQKCVSQSMCDNLMVGTLAPT